MQIVTHSHREGSWTVITIAGELDVVGGPELRQVVMGEVRAGHHHLVLDLTGVDFIDSFGLGVVVGALKRSRLLDGDVRLVVPEPRVRRVFEVCDLDRVFVLHPTVDDAVAGTVASA
ncbi:MAG: STAS domain-containing protein [Acidimicrobiales bacterium]